MEKKANNYLDTENPKYRSAEENERRRERETNEIKYNKEEKTGEDIGCTEIVH